MHFVRVKGILSSKNGMNIYRGCSHGCIYCDSRSKCYQMKHEFKDIEIKENALELLENTLKHKRKKCIIGTGAMSDPYMPIEKVLGYTRKAMNLAYQYGFGFTLITKSDLVLRDLDLLKKINDQSKAVVQVTLTTYDDQLSKQLEPNVCTTQQRIEILRRCAQLNIPTIVWLCPILPFINDTKENIEAILNACIEYKVKGIICFGMGVTLREGNREYFYEQLKKLYPNLLNKYIKIYGNRYILSSPHHQELMKYFHTTCEANGILHDVDTIFRYLNTYETKNEQLSLF